MKNALNPKATLILRREASCSQTSQTQCWSKPVGQAASRCIYICYVSAPNPSSAMAAGQRSGKWTSVWEVWQWTANKINKSINPKFRSLRIKDGGKINYNSQRVRDFSTLD